MAFRAELWATVLRMPKAERRTLLRRCGWVQLRVGEYRTEAWRPRDGWTNEVYTLAAATKAALERAADGSPAPAQEGR